MRISRSYVANDVLKYKLSLQNRRLFFVALFFPPHSLPLVSNTRTNHPSFNRTPFLHTSALQHSIMYTPYYDATKSTPLNIFEAKCC